MDERSMLFVGIIIVVVIGALVWSSNRATPNTGKQQQSGRTILPPTRRSTTAIQVEKRPTASSPQDVTTASADKATDPVPQFNRHPSHPTSAQPTAAVTPSAEEQQLSKALLSKAHGDRGKVARLIAYERQRTPKGTQLDWLRDAIERWERDNR